MKKYDSLVEKLKNKIDNFVTELNRLQNEYKKESSQAKRKQILNSYSEIYKKLELIDKVTYNRNIEKILKTKIKLN